LDRLYRAGRRRFQTPRRAEANWGVAPSASGATWTTSPTWLASPVAGADGAGVTLPGSPGAALERSTVASAALGQSGAGSALPTSSACCAGTDPSDCDGTMGVGSSAAATADRPIPHPRHRPKRNAHAEQPLELPPHATRTNADRSPTDQLGHLSHWTAKSCGSTSAGRTPTTSQPRCRACSGSSRTAGRLTAYVLRNSCARGGPSEDRSRRSVARSSW
jgi:hypothetical protein